jgi:hypothetical protein
MMRWPRAKALIFESDNRRAKEEIQSEKEKVIGRHQMKHPGGWGAGPSLQARF